MSKKRKNIMGNEKFREKALELAIKHADCSMEELSPNELINRAKFIYRYLKGDDYKQYGELSHGWHMRNNPNDEDIEIACDILNKANITEIETHYELTTQGVKLNNFDFRVVGNTLIIGS